MTDPYPEARRRRRHDRTDHRRERESRQRDRPSRKAIDAALSQVANHEVPGTPKTMALGLLQEVHESEWETDTRTVRDFAITRGDPQHGAHRSEDHIGRYELEVPFAEVDDAAVEGDACPECGGPRALYKYHAHHYIAGSESLFCLACKTKLYGEEWG